MCYIVVYFVTLHFVYGKTHGVEECHSQGFCKNGGTCILNSDLPAARNCYDDEAYHMEFCYSFILQPMNWNSAVRYCNEQGKVLALTQSDDDQRFYAGYVYGSLLASNRLGYGVTGVWTSLRRVSNGSGPVWVSFPGSNIVRKHYWKPVGLDLNRNYDNACVSLQEETMYRYWTPQSCDALNYVVCKRRALDQDFSSNRLAQCLCQQDFGGVQCEKSIRDVNKAVSSVQSVSCSSTPFEFVCHDSATIQVEFASLGASEGYACSPTMRSWEQTCSDSSSLKTIINKCDGLVYCSIQNLSKLFPETPCPVTSELYLQYRFSCVTRMQMKCPPHSLYLAGRCFTIDTKRIHLSHTKAKQVCRSQGGYLASNIEASMDSDLSRQLVRRGKEDEAFWIDLQVGPNGRLIWSDGNQVTYRPKSSTFMVPNSCVAYVISGGMADWTSLPCDASANYLCAFPPSTANQRREIVVPSPTSERRIAVEGFPLSQEYDDVFASARYCNAEALGPVRYPRARACTETRVPCPDPDNIIGTIVRYCNCETAEWRSPDTTNCTHKWISEAKSAIERGDPVEDISGLISANLESSLAQQLYGGDIIGSVLLGTDVLKLARQQFSTMFDRNQRQLKATNFTESFGSSGDHLLSPRAVSTWQELSQSDRIEHASMLMGLLEQSALLLADYSVDEQKKILYKNWAMEIDVRRTETQPNRSGGMFTPSGFRAAQLSPMNDNFQTFAGPLRPRTSAPISPRVQFSEFGQSPIISLPSLDVLKTSSIAANQLKSGTPVALFYPGVPMPKATLDRSRIRLGYYVFTTFGKLLDDSDGKTIVNSHVIGASVDDATIRLRLPDNQPATFTFYHLRRDGVSNPRCVYWDVNVKKWNTNGCEIISTNNETTKCACNHLTSFAVLMDVSGKVSQYSGAIAAALDVVSIIGCALSIVCLTMSLFVFTFFSSLYSVRNAIHRNLCLTLIFSELIFVMGIDRTESPVGCSIVALLLHYFFLVAFCWMLLEGYQLYLMLIQVFEPDKTRMLLYYMFSYGLPAVVVAVSAGVAWDNYGTNEYCWINTSTPTVWAFIGPVAVVIVINIIFLAVALKVVLSMKSRDRSRSDRVVGWLKGSATLLCLLGVTWIFGFLTVINGTGGVVFAWIFTILNCTQGVFIFILHVVMNEKVCSTLARWLRSGICCLPDKTSIDNSKEYTSSRHRIMNIVKANCHSSSTPNTASTDDKEKQLTPISKTNEWLRCVTVDSYGSPLSSRRLSGNTDTIHDDSMSNDLRSSQMSAHRESVEKHAPVKRKKFPLGASEYERGSKDVIVERF